MSVQAGTCWVLKRSITSWKGRGMRKLPAEKEEACGRSADWAIEIEQNAHTALANNVYAIRTLNKEPAEWSVAQKDNDNVAQASRWSSITNNETTSTTYQIPAWHHDDWWKLCSTSCNCNGASSLSFGCSSYMTRYDWRTTNQSKNDANDYDYCEKMQRVFDGTNKI